MSADAERIAFDTEIITTFTTTPLRFGTVQENDRITTEDNLWLQCRLVPGGSFNGSIGTNSVYLKKRLGMYEMTVWDREEHGDADIIRAIDSIENLFIGKAINFGKTIITRTNCLPVGSKDGWQGKQITISYTTSEQVNR